MSPPKKPLNQPTIQVLIAVCSPETQASLREMLSPAPGIEITGAAAHGDEAVQMAVELEPDVVLMEVELPGGGGIAATKRIAEQSPATRVILIASEAQDDDLRRALLAGASDFLTLPLSAEELILTIRRVHGSNNVERVVDALRRARSQQGPLPRDAYLSLKARVYHHVMQEKKTGEKILELVRIVYEDALRAERVALSHAERERLLQLIWRDILLELLAKI